MLLKFVVLNRGATEVHVCPKVLGGEDGRQVQTVGLPVVNSGIHVQKLNVPNRLIQGSKAKFCKIFPDLFRQELKEVDNVVSLSGVAGTKLGVLACDPNRAGVQVAGAHQDAALNHQRSSGKAILLSTEQCGNYNVTTGLHGAINLNRDAVAQSIEKQGLLSLSKA